MITHIIENEPKHLGDVEISEIRSLINKIYNTGLKEPRLVAKLSTIKKDLNELCLENERMSIRAKLLNLIERELDEREIYAADINGILRYFTPIKTIKKNCSTYVDYFIFDNEYISIEKNILNPVGAVYDESTIILYKKVTKDMECTFIVPSNSPTNEYYAKENIISLKKK